MKEHERRDAIKTAAQRRDYALSQGDKVLAHLYQRQIDGHRARRRARKGWK